MKVFLLDGTYELFRQFYGRPGHRSATLGEVDAVRGVLASVLTLIEQGATHIGVATDHIIESFRNDLWPGYKTGAGIDPDLWNQFPILEDALIAMGIKTWPMVELEADDALATAASVAYRDDRVDQVAIMSPDKDLAQCVIGAKVVQVDQRKNKVFDEAGVLEKFGVMPSSIPDYLALVGDSADGFPGLQGWGAKSTATVLHAFETIEQIPLDVAEWKLNVRSAATLVAKLEEQYELAMLFKDLATLRVDEALLGSVDELVWQGPSKDFAKIVEKIEAPRLLERVAALRS